MDKVKIAVIDNGVAEGLLRQPLEYKVYIDNTNCCLIDDGHIELSGFIHGTICAMIIENNFSECLLSSVKILNEDGIGKVDKLRIALDWCYQNNIFLVNLSLGMTHFHDKAVVRNVINHYANRGMIIVAASANSGYKTYPASFSNVIGVVAGKVFEVNTNLQKQKGIDFMAVSDHEMKIEGNSFKLGISNSYAAPYVTAMIGKLLEKKSCNNICHIRKELMPETKFIYYPDWIEAAWVSEKCERSRAGYYFREVGGELENCIPKIDTIVIKTREEIEKYHNQKKNIVYLGKEPIENTLFERHFWSREQRISQISDTKERVSDINIPLIICKLPEKQDVNFWLSELRGCLGKDGYNVYAVSVKEESVLYDLEFLPEELCNTSNMDQIHNFLYWQTYLSQSDVILVGINKKVYSDLDTLEIVSDMLIEVSEVDKVINVQICCDGNIKVEKTFNYLDYKAINILCIEIFKLFAEDTDE